MSEGSLGVNPELQEERDRASFPLNDLSVLIYGSQDFLRRREEIATAVLADPNLRDPKPVVFMTREERYENVCRKLEAMTRCGEELGLSDLTEIAYFEGLTMARETAPLALHYVMFIPTLQSQMTEEQQEKWLPLAFSRAIVGTYAQTELGHGTNVRRLETRATYEAGTEEFVMETPTLTATKWWPGNLGKSVNYAIVMAQLHTQGRNHGVHAFLVQLRDTRTHLPRPGVRVGDIGPKFGMASNDNGFLVLNKVRIPRENMLMRNAKVEKDGTYIPPKHEKLAYGSMSYVRSIMIKNQATSLAIAATIAVRYSCVRRQGEMKQDEGEVKLLDYHTQQYRILPELAKAYCFYFAGVKMQEIYSDTLDQISQGNVEEVLPDMHSISSGLKAVVSWEVAQGIEQCRLSCGGHGYMLASGLPELYGLTVGGCTYEGDNIVLLLQVARFLMKAGERVREGRKVTSPFASYLSESETGRSRLEQSLRQSDLSAAFAHVARRLVFQCVDELRQLRQRGLTTQDAWNRCSILLCKAARAHVRVYLVRTFAEKADSVLGTPIHSVVGDLCRLYSLHSLSRQAKYVLQDGYMDKQQFEYIREELGATLFRLRKEAVALVDAWGFRDRELRSVLGGFDGRVYEALLDSVKYSSFNKDEVMKCHHEYLGKMMEGARSKL